uniref:Uncharacterized protein n=1 Tax=Plectus sambesii TaxID=2011161 RepID=A0A914V7Y9_9BILA
MPLPPQLPRREKSTFATVHATETMVHGRPPGKQELAGGRHSFCPLAPCFCSDPVAMGVSTQFSLMPLLLVLFDAPLAVTQFSSNGLQMTAIDDLQYAYAPPSASNDWAMATGNESAVEGVLGLHMQNGGRLINTGYFNEPRTGRMRFYGIVHQFNGPVYLNPAPMNYSELTRQ